MEIEVKKNDNAALVTLKGDLSIYTTPALKEKLQKIVEESEKIAIDLDGVSEVDTAAIQVLMMVKKETVKKGKILKLINHTPAVVRMIDIMGLVGFFGDKIKIPAEERGDYRFKYGVKKTVIV